MRGVMRVLEATAVLVPDFQTLGLFVPTFFSLLRCAIALGLTGTRGIKADVLISLVLGYVVAIVLNLADAVTLPGRPHHAPVSHSALRKTQIVCEGAEVPSFDKGYSA